jgi:ArsR family transcriptional regulator, arsenate/arsenite/antimonite-responsive transcriptional repressor
MDTVSGRRLLPGVGLDASRVDSNLLPRLKALADPTRLKILRQLLRAPEPVCVCEISALHELSQATISHHLKLLREAGLIRGERRGTWIYYQPNRYAVSDLGSALARL